MYGIGYEKSDVKTKRVGTGFKSLTSDSHFPKLQENFEHNLGTYAYRNSNAIEAVDKGLEKMRKVLVEYYKDKYSHIKDQAEREAQICLDAFTNTDDPTSAGQIGKVKYAQLWQIIGNNVPQGDKEINSQIDKQTGMAGASNLREKMTAFYNAAYYKGYQDENPEKNITNFKNIAQKIAVGGKSELVDELDLDRSILEEQKNTSTNPIKAGIVRALYNAGAGHKVMGFFGKIARVFNKDFKKDEDFAKRMHTRDVYDMALISLGQKSMGAMMDNIKSGSNLRYRNEEEQKEIQRPLDYYNKMGLNLSEREKNYILETLSQRYLTSHRIPEQDEKEAIGTFQKGPEESTEAFNKRMKEYAIRYAVYMDKIRKKLDPDYTPAESLEKGMYDEFANDPMLNEEVEKTKSPIKEGIVYKDIPKKGGFLKDIMIDKHNVRIVNGISMTTARMLKTYRWLNLGSGLKNFRLALMGWMLPTDDHSLWEIIIGSHNVGVKGKEDLTDIVSLDQSVDPLTKSELRMNACEKVDCESLFPHEIVYLKQRYDLENDKDYRKTNTVSSNLLINNDDKKSIKGKFKNKTGEIFQPEEEKKLLFAKNMTKEEQELFNEKFKVLLKITNFDFNCLFKKVEEKVYIKDNNKYDEYVKTLKEHKELYEELFGFEIDFMYNDPKTIEYILSLKENGLELIAAEYIKRLRIGHTAQKIAVLNYTGNIYQAMNEEATSADGGYFKRLYFKSSLKNHFYNIADLQKAREKYCKDRKKAKNNHEKEEALKKIRNVDESIEKKRREGGSDKEYQQYIMDLDAEVNMTKDALDSAPKKSNIHVYSGTWMAKSKLFSSYKENKIIKFNMFTSTSRDINVAKGFIGGLYGLSGVQELVGKNALLDIKLTGKKAVDLTDGSDVNNKNVMSVFGTNEKEVLCPPGTKIKINEVIDDVDLEAYKGAGDVPKIMSREDYEKEKKEEREKKKDNKKRFGTLVKCEEV